MAKHEETQASLGWPSKPKRMLVFYGDKDAHFGDTTYAGINRAEADKPRMDKKETIQQKRDKIHIKHLEVTELLGGALAVSFYGCNFIGRVKMIKKTEVAAGSASEARIIKLLNEIEIEIDIANLAEGLKVEVIERVNKDVGSK